MGGPEKIPTRFGLLALPASAAQSEAYRRYWREEGQRTIRDPLLPGLPKDSYLLQVDPNPNSPFPEAVSYDRFQKQLYVSRCQWLSGSTFPAPGSSDLYGPPTAIGSPLRLGSHFEGSVVTRCRTGEDLAPQPPIPLADFINPAMLDIDSNFPGPELVFESSGQIVYLGRLPDISADIAAATRGTGIAARWIKPCQEDQQVRSIRTEHVDNLLAQYAFWKTALAQFTISPDPMRAYILSQLIKLAADLQSHDILEWHRQSQKEFVAFMKLHAPPVIDLNDALQLNIRWHDQITSVVGGGKSRKWSPEDLVDRNGDLCNDFSYGGEDRFFQRFYKAKVLFYLVGGTRRTFNGPDFWRRAQEVFSQRVLLPGSLRGSTDRHGRPIAYTGRLYFDIPWPRVRDILEKAARHGFRFVRVVDRMTKDLSYIPPQEYRKRANHEAFWSYVVWQTPRGMCITVYLPGETQLQFDLGRHPANRQLRRFPSARRMDRLFRNR